jgi:hypothetical protein
VYTTTIELDRLALDRAAVERKQVVPTVSEVRPDGKSQTTVSQWMLDPDSPDRVFLAWRASPAPEGPRQFQLTLQSRSTHPRIPVPQLQVIPELHDNLSIRWKGNTLLGYCYSTAYPKPFFYPVVGPAGHSLTRLGHPRDFSGGHDHHRSLWIEHLDVNRVSFETEHQRYFDEPDSPIIGVGRQLHRNFLQQEDGPLFAALGMLVDWVDHTETTLLTEERRVQVYALEKGEQFIDFRLTFSPQVETVTFGQTNYGVLAVRFATALEAIRGNGTIRNARGGVNEPELHLKPAEWCDCSGPIEGEQVNGLAIFDHPSNVHSPAHWHVRGDGWLCAAPFYAGAVTIQRGETLTLRYRVFVHDGDDMARIAAKYREYANPPQISF